MSTVNVVFEKIACVVVVRVNRSCPSPHVRSNCMSYHTVVSVFPRPCVF